MRQRVPLVDYSIAEEHVPLRNFSELLADTVLTATCAARRSVVVPTRCRLWWHQQVDQVELVGELVVFDEISSCSSLLQCSQAKPT